MQQSFIFGGNTGLSYDQIQKQREIANELLRANMSTPQNVGEGLSAIGRALAAKAIDKRTARADEENRKAYEARRSEIFGALGGFGPGGANSAYGGSVGTAAPVTGPTPITFTPETPNPAGLDPSIISAVDRVAPNKPQVMDANAVGSRLVSDLMRDLNLTQEQAAGVVGNLAHETGGFKHMQEIAPVVPGSRGGFGIAQWTGPRRKAFEAWAAENGLDPNSYEANYGFLQHELKNTPEGAVLGPLSQAQTAEEAARVFSDQFLRPGIPAMGSRLAFANQFAGDQPAPMPAGQPAGNTPNPAILMALAETAGNPYASDSDKIIAQLLMDQTMQAMDPMRQMEMERARLELEQMRQPEAPKPIEVGGVLLDPITREVIFDSRQEKGPAAVVNVGGEGENSGAFNKKADEAAAARFDGYVQAGNNANRMMGDINALVALAPQIGTGKEAEIKAALGPYAEALGFDIEGLDEAQAFQSIVDRMAPAMRPAGSGASSDFDAKQFLSSLPQLGRTPEGNQIIIQTMTALQQHQIAAADIASRAMLPPDDPNFLRWQDAEKKIRELGDPYTTFNEYKKSLPKEEAKTDGMDFSKMSAAELSQIDINTLTPVQMEAMLKRFDEVGQ